MTKMNIICLLLVGMFVVGLCCSKKVFAEDEEGGNNLSLPVIWADDVNKPLRGDPDWPTTGDNYWYVWYEDGNEMVCNPAVGGDCPDPLPDDAKEVYPQRDPCNTWQAESLQLVPNGGEPVDVTFIDWGDNLEAKDWFYRSIIRTETILYQDISATPMTAYEMIWLEGQGVGEVWGSTLYTEQSDEATVYTGCARLTIQELLVDPYEVIIIDGNECRVPIDNSRLGLTWNDDPCSEGGQKWIQDLCASGDSNVGDTYFQSAVWEATGQQDYEVYSAEINVKGKVIYGYNWNTREDSGGDGYYRITFSMDNSNPDIQLNTVFDTTQVLLAEEDPDGGDENNNTTGGGIAVIDYDNDLTYIDVTLLPKKGGNGNCNKHR